jgi:hypothetical protein
MRIEKTEPKAGGKSAFLCPGPERTSAIALLWGGEMAGKIIVAWPRDGAGVVRATVQLFCGTDAPHGPEYVAGSGSAGGYGYDKSSAAILDALRRAGLELVGDHGALNGGCGRSAVWAAFRELGYQVVEIL